MDKGYKVFYYLSETKNPIKEFINSLSERERAKIRRIFEAIQIYGLQAVSPHTKKLTGTPLWEIRILGNDSIRIIYLVPQAQTVLVLHGFLKKSQKIPEKEISIAMNRYNDYLKKTTLDK